MVTAETVYCLFAMLSSSTRTQAGCRVKVIRLPTACACPDVVLGDIFGSQLKFCAIALWGIQLGYAICFSAKFIDGMAFVVVTPQLQDLL